MIISKKQLDIETNLKRVNLVRFRNRALKVTLGPNADLKYLAQARDVDAEKCLKISNLVIFLC